ncbi:hypothetical protein QQZ08_012171 [Neonectria magnoliae]|uniref:NAD-dependent epimerase/dehydratase domain-containing protein n=1 Tax=Neonectria magnoliae TaxID=2732573 RepID=A0ABR1H4G2_9HYPO
MTEKRIVLVTGANGYIAGPVIEAFFKAGYVIRGTVRSKASANALLDALSQYRNDIETVEVPDIVAPGAFDDAIKDWNTESLEAVKQLGKKSRGPLIYLASKVASERAFWEFRVENKPSFTMTAINPMQVSSPHYMMSHMSADMCNSFVVGPPVALESLSKISGTTAFILQEFAGQEIPTPISPDPGYVDVRDIARVVVFGVEHADKADGERCILANGVVPPQAAANVLREAFPDRRDIIKIGTPGKGYYPGLSFLETRFIDSSKAIEETGQDHDIVE